MSKAQAIIESLKSVYNESTVTTSDVPDYDKLKSAVLTKGTVLPMPTAPHISVIQLDGHTYTHMDASHPQAPNGMKDSVTSTPDGIEHIKTITSNVSSTDK